MPSRVGATVRQSSVLNLQSTICNLQSSVGLLVCLAATWAFPAGNLVQNGGFEKGDKAPDFWHVKLTDFMPKEQVNAQGFKSYRYICGCGNDLGDVKPWCGLICPKCGGFISGEECGAWYMQNHERVSLEPGAHGRCVKFTLPTDVGNNQGVRIMSYLIKAKPGWGYKLSFSARTKGSTARVFVECFRYPERMKSSGEWQGPADPAASKTQIIERSYRAHVNCGSPAAWQTFTKEVVAPKRYQFDYMSVKLYAYLPGEAWFDDVSLVPMTASELKEYTSKRHPKDDRFEY